MDANHSWCGGERSLDGSSGLLPGNMDDDSSTPLSSYNVAGLFRAFYMASGKSSPLYGFANPAHSAAIKPHQHSGRGSRYQDRR